MSVKLLLIIFGLLFVSVVNLQAQNRSGVYRYSKVDRDGNEYGGEITIREVKHKKKTVVYFKINIGIYNKKCVSCWCVGEIDGDAKWTSENVADYNSVSIEDTCRLTFFFSGNKLTVREYDCGSSHGVLCSFDGTFIKVVPKKKKKRGK